MNVGIAKKRFETLPELVRADLRPAIIREIGDHTVVINGLHEAFCRNRPILFPPISDPMAREAKRKAMEEKRRQFDEEIERRQSMWSKVRGSWVKAENLMQSVLSRVTIGRVDPRTKSLRILSCHGVDESGTQVRPACPYRAYSVRKGHHYCDACGCGEKSIASLSSKGSMRNEPRFDGAYMKLDYPYLECPLGQAGFSNEKAQQESPKLRQAKV